MVLEAGDLAKNSALRKLFEADAKAAAIPCYADSARDLGDVVRDELKGLGFALAPGAAHLIELPRKMALSQERYFIVQRIYAGWALFGIPIAVQFFALALLTWFIIYRTSLGTQVRAIIRNPKMAAACGIDVTRVNALTFAFGSGLAGVAGVMMSGFKTVFPDMGTPMVVDGFLVVVMGGVGSLLGSVLSAGMLGEINGLVAAATNDILARAVVFGVVIAIIILKPKGLFALKGR